MDAGKKNGGFDNKKKDIYWEKREKGEQPTHETHS
jgi:hypothetical protein